MRRAADAPRLIRVEEPGAPDLGAAALCGTGIGEAPELDRVRRRTGRLTAAVCVLALAAAGAGLAADRTYLALLPVAFVLGWLNLVGF